MDQNGNSVTPPLMQFLAGDGEMAVLTRSYDWSQVSIGSFGKWPQSLKTIVSMLLHSDFPMFLWWGPEMIQFYNDAYRPSLGESGKHPRALGQRGKECWPEIWDTIFPLIEQVRISRKSFFIEDSLIPIYRNGRLENVYWTFSYSAIIGETGDVDGILVVCNETTKKVETLLESVEAKTALQESETRFRSLIEHAPVATCMFVGPEFRVEVANDAILQYWQKDWSVIGKSFAEAVPELGNQPFLQLLEEVYASGKTYSSKGALAQLPVNGEIQNLYFDFTFKPLLDPQGNVYAIINMAIDVTDQVKGVMKLQDSESRFRHLSEKLEEVVNLRTEQLTRSNEDLQRFAHVASHDLKEPVRKIKTFTGRLQDEMGDLVGARGNIYLEKIQKATDRMVSMIDGVLAYSSMNAAQLVPTEIDLNTVVENIKTDLEVLIQQRNARILYKELPRLQGAPVLIYQLFYNLINNSMKFAQPDRPPIITLAAHTFLRDRQAQAQIVIQDNGIGFDEEFSLEIFNTFTRLNPKDKFEGTGLGLALCKSIVQRHGGSISASSVKGDGATFTIVLPLKQTEEV